MQWIVPVQNPWNFPLKMVTPLLLWNRTLSRKMGSLTLVPLNSFKKLWIVIGGRLIVTDGQGRLHTKEPVGEIQGQKHYNPEL